MAKQWGQMGSKWMCAINAIACIKVLCKKKNKGRKKWQKRN
jgi:hypothetical protein